VRVCRIYCSYYAGQTYAYFLLQFTAVLYLLWLLPVVCWRMWVTGEISPAMRATVPASTYFIMGLLDTLYNQATTMSSPRTSAPVQNLLFQLPVPLTMVLSKLLWPRTRYTRGQYIGAFVIVAGAITSILPQLIHPPAPDSDATGTSDSAPDNNVGSVLLYLAGVLFYALGSVYKEWALKKAPTIDYWYMSLVENWWCFLLAFPTIPFLWIPGVGRDTPATTWPHFKAGAKCMFHGVSDLDPDAKCEHLLPLCIVWILLNVLVNILGLRVCRHGDSVLYNVVGSVQLPVSNLMYASSFVMTAALASQFDQAMWVGLIIVTAGFVVYQFMPLENGQWFIKHRARAHSRDSAADVTAAGDGDHTPGGHDNNDISEVRLVALDHAASINNFASGAAMAMSEADHAAYLQGNQIDASGLGTSSHNATLRQQLLHSER